MKAKETDLSNAKRGAIVKVPKGRTIVRMGIDDGILNWFREQVHRAGGGDYEELINAALHHHIQQQDLAFEKNSSPRHSRRVANNGKASGLIHSS